MHILGPVGLSNKPSCEAWSFSSCHNLPTPLILIARGLEALFPCTESWVELSVSLPSCPSGFLCTQMWYYLLMQLPPLCTSSLAPLRLPLSAFPTSLNKRFFFNSLVVRLPYSSIFCQFSLFFVSKLVVIPLVVQGEKVCRPTLPSCPEVIFSFLLW